MKPQKRRLVTVGALVLMLPIAFAVGWVRLPYYSIGPGPARDVEPLIVVHGRTTYPSAGHFVMTTVQYEQLTPITAVVAWLDPHHAVVKQEQLFGVGVTAQQEQQRSVSQMDQSKINATYVVLTQLDGYPKDHGKGALVEGTIEGCPAQGVLYSGDVIRSIDGKPVTSQQGASDVLGTVAAGQPVSIGIVTDGTRQTVSLTRARCAGSKDPIVGVYLVDAFPFGVSISSGDVGGPSAGMMWALGLYDELTPGDLTGGRTIAGTGTIDLNGAIGPIGGITDKVVAAEQAGAQVFLAPEANMKDLKGIDTGSMKIVPVATFDDALRYLQGGA